MAKLFREKSPYWRLFKRVSLIGLLIFILINAFSDSEKVHSLRESWNRSGLEFSEMERIVNRCKGSEAEFLGCLRATEIVLRFLHLPINVNFKFGSNPDVILKSGEVESTAPTLQERKDFFNRGFAAKVNFTKFFQNLHTLVVPSADEGLITGLALNAWLNEVDPHSGILPRSYVRELEKSPSLKEANFGIGINFRRLQDRCIITSVLEKSAAALAGIMPGDQLLSVDQLTCSDYTSFQVSELLQKDVQENIPIQIVYRRNQQNHAVTVAPKFLANNSVEWEVNEDILIVRILNFYQTNTCDLLKSALNQARESNLRGIVLDMRSNPGGYIEEVACAAGLFLGQGVAVANFSRIPESELMSIGDQIFPVGLAGSSEFKRVNFALLSTQPQVTHLPTVVIINHATASSAEILAGALQDYNRAWIVGATSFGKGTMQTSATLKRWPKLQLTQTTHRIRMPSGREMQYHGVRPNFRTQGGEGPREAEIFPQSLHPLEPPPERLIGTTENALNVCIKKRKIDPPQTSPVKLALEIFNCLALQ
jgi:carboxyl-terminal processing protease